MKVLFVCAGNAYRSPVAEALLKKLNPQAEADSAGLHPGIPVSGAAKSYLTRENAQQFLKKSPEGLESKRLNEYDLIVAMEPQHKEAILHRCPECEGKIVVWNVDDPYFLPHRRAEEVFEQIKEKVLDLVDSL